MVFDKWLFEFSLIDVWDTSIADATYCCKALVFV